jgi:parvulin-like peptidyl-prolyl isomerase
LTKHRTAQAKASIEARKSAGKTTAKQPKRVPAKPRPKVQKKRPTGAIYGAKHILVAYKGARRASPKIKRSKDEAKKLAAKVVKQARADKKAWPKLVKTHSDEPGAARRQGDLGRFRKGSMVPQFQTAVEKLKVGGVSEVVETAFGYHVIWRTL